MDKKSILTKLTNLQQAYAQGKIPRLHQHEVNPGLDKESRENYLYFIMTCALNFQRSSPNTRKSALATWEDKTTRFVFYPEEVVSSPIEKLRAALLKHKLALQPNKHIAIRQKISTTRHEYFADDPRTFFANMDFDVTKILFCLQKDMKKNFPYLSGPKLSNYFLFILLEYADLKLVNTEEISIIPDTHIMQATKVLGLTDKESITPLQTETLWSELLQDTRYSPIEFHSLLRNRSRNNFIPSC